LERAGAASTDCGAAAGGDCQVCDEVEFEVGPLSRLLPICIARCLRDAKDSRFSGDGLGLDEVEFTDVLSDVEVVAIFVLAFIFIFIFVLVFASDWATFCLILCRADDCACACVCAGAGGSEAVDALPVEETDPPPTEDESFRLFAQFRCRRER
jgi:hypothetical protein